MSLVLCSIYYQLAQETKIWEQVTSYVLCHSLLIHKSISTYIN